ncbi:hypothetical protein YC2023_123656 [Brassica napus]
MAGKVRPASKSAAKVSSKQSHTTASSLGADETKVKRLELKLDSRTLKADPTSDHLFFSRLTAAPDPPSICPDLAPPRSEQPLATRQQVCRREMEWYQKGKRKRRGRVEGVASDAARVADAGGGAAALGFLQVARLLALIVTYQQGEVIVGGGYRYWVRPCTKAAKSCE